jgi:hypothetical protein
MLTLKSGDLAYFDSFSGLAPCKVLSICRARYGGYIVTIKHTVDIGPYKRGETSEKGWLSVVPRDAVIRFRGCFSPRILPYEVIPDA